MGDLTTVAEAAKLLEQYGFGVVAGAMLLGWFAYHSRRQESRFDKLFDRLIGDKGEADKPAEQRGHEVRENGTIVGLSELGSRVIRVEQRVEEIAEVTTGTLKRIEASLDGLPCNQAGNCPMHSVK